LDDVAYQLYPVDGLEPRLIDITWPALSCCVLPSAAASSFNTATLPEMYGSISKSVGTASVDVPEELSCGFTVLDPELVRLPGLQLVNENISMIVISARKDFLNIIILLL